MNIRSQTEPEYSKSNEKVEKMKFSVLLSIIGSVLCDNIYRSEAYTCYNDSAKLNEVLVSKDESVDVTFHVCANTTWNMGTYIGNSFVGGTFPIMMTRSNTKVLCGPDGDVKNNCKLVGGSAGVEIFTPTIYYDPPSLNSLEGLVIEGFTFTGGNKEGSIYSFRQSLTYVELTVRNCHFVNNPNMVGGNIYLQTDNTYHSVPNGEKITVEDCHFENNTIVQGVGLHALISGFHSPIIDVKRSKFIKNTGYMDVTQFKSTISYIIQGADLNTITPKLPSNAQVSVVDSCFEENGNFYSLVSQSNMTEYSSISNYQNLNDVSCEGIVYYDSIYLDFENNNTKCAKDGFTASRCTATTEVPSSMPSSMPSISSMPSSIPSSIPSSMPSISSMPSSKPSISSMPSSIPSSMPSSMPQEKPSDTSSSMPRKKSQAMLMILITMYYCLV